MFDNAKRDYCYCPTCNAMHVIRRGWSGPRPSGAIRCHCGAVIDLCLFRYAYTGERWSARWYAAHPRQATGGNGD
jgi:hypothetical protein